MVAVYVFSLSVNIGRIGYFAFAFLSPWILYTLLGRKHIIIFVVFVSALLMILSLSPTVQHRTNKAVDEIKEYYNGDKNTSVGRRLHMWEGAIKIFLENPVIGVGTGGYANAMKKYRDDPALPEYFSHPHNSFLYMAVSFGTIGLIIFIWLLVIFFKKGWQARSTIEGFSVLSFGAVLLIGSMTDTQIMSLATGNIFALMVGIRSNN
jgi:O-antigen ligase